MDDLEGDDVIKKLSAIQKTYRIFTDKDFTIYDCVKLILLTPVSIHIIAPDLPADIRFDIEAIFYL